MTRMHVSAPPSGRSLSVAYSGVGGDSLSSDTRQVAVQTQSRKEGPVLYVDSGIRTCSHWNIVEG